jgi:S1-C subfamily serine protease
MEKIVISSGEISETRLLPEQPGRPEPKLAPVVTWWAKVSLAPLVVVLPLLCLISLILRVAMRALPPRTRHGWTAFLNTLLIISGLLTSLSAIAIFSFVPLPSLVSAGLSELDERSDFPKLPAVTAMSARDISEKLKPLVAVINPGQRSWLTHQEMPSGSFGAGMLLQANAEGYLFVTAHHVLDGPAWKAAKSTPRVLIAMASGSWGAAEVIARHKNLDLALLWVPRDLGGGNFAEPIANSSDVTDGESVFVIGHPEGLRFTLSTGIISRTDSSTIQMSAPVSPGNSGGPVFDDKGALVAIVTSMVDKHGDPNAENLNFAVRADALLDDSGWNFEKFGHKRLAEYRASASPGNAAQLGSKP